MDQTEHLLLVNTESKEHHRLLESEYVIGRGWLNCEDKRISRKHGILKLTSNGSLSLTSTHVNPIFFKTKNDGTLQMIKKDDDSTVLSPGDSFGFFPDAFWFEIVKSNVQSDEPKEIDDASSVMETTSNESSAEAVKRKLPTWLSGNNNKKRRGDNDVTASNDGDIAAATEDNNTEINNTVVERNEQDSAETRPENSAAEDSPLTGNLTAPDETADNRRMRSNDDEPSTSRCGDIGRAAPTENTRAGSGVVEQSELIESPLEPDRDELAMLIDAIQADSQGAMEVEGRPSKDSNVTETVGDALEPEPDEQLELPVAVDENRNETIDAAQVNSNIIAAENTNETDDAMPLPNIQIKAEPVDDTENTAEAIDGVPLPKVLIKTEPNVGNIAAVAGPSAAAVAGPSGAVPIKQEVKKEVKTEPDSSADSKVPKRDCCPYGVKCYRRNPVHRAEAAHPGDADYRLPSYGDPLPGAPPCPYGARCYRRNPTHFRQFSHPPSTDPDANRKALRAKKAGIAKKIDDDEDEDDDDSDVNDEDPFAGGDSSDDPDFVDDMISDDDDDEESGKDSGHESIATENEDN